MLSSLYFGEESSNLDLNVKKSLLVESRVELAESFE